MSFSYSKVNTFEQCPYKFKLRYKDHLKPVPNLDPGSALFLGTACHTGIEKRSIEEAFENYKANFPYLVRQNDIELLKLYFPLKKAIETVPEGEYEHCISCDDGFVGYIDCLVKNEDGTYDILDFKYSNNKNKYKRSPQIHIYKYYFESLTGNKVKNIYYVFIPKYSEKNNFETMTDDEIKEKLLQYFSDKEVELERIPYNPQLVEFFFKTKTQMDNATEFVKKPSPYCRNCDYFKYCSTNGQDTTGLIIEQEKQEPTPQPVSLFEVI